jgi:hypothetical protein
MKFADSVLSKNEMKEVRGGACQVCSNGGPGGNRTCGSYSLDFNTANSLVNELEDTDDGYSYSMHCH